MSDGGAESLGLGRETQGEAGQFLPRARRDVEITEQVYYGKPCYVLKDPTTLRYYRLRPPEYTIFRMLDGAHRMEDVQRALAERFPQDEYDAGAVLNFLVMLRSASLLETSGAAGAEFLLQRKSQQERGFFKRMRQEYLFYRIPLIDPDRVLNWLERNFGRFLFSRFMQVAATVFFVGAVLLVLGHVDKMGQRQPLLSWINLLYLLPALAFIKVVHEFGHGWSAKHFGCEVHEMGILFLVFMPCAYCDVSDAWMISQKRRRMWITAAGIVIEMMLAAAAGYVWVLTEPKTVINQFALNMMIVASVNTLLFNGNPLLRYDGYYFMMDLMEIPNLKQKGGAYLWYLMQRYVLGVSDAAKPLDVEGREPGVLGFAICSAIYRWFIMFAIIAMVWTFLDPYGWGVVGAVMALAAIYSSFMQPVGRFFKFLATRWEKVHLRPVTAVVLVVLAAGAAYGVLAIPIEQTVEGQCVLRPAEMRGVYVTRGWFLEVNEGGGFVQDWQMVELGEVLVRLSDPQLEAQAADLQLQLEQLEEARRRAQRASAVTETVEQIDARLRGVRAQYESVEANRERLLMRAPMGGRVELRTDVPLEQLAGSFMAVGTAVLAVYEPGVFEAVTAVNHRDIGQVQVGQGAQVRLWAWPGQTFESVVREKPGEAVSELSSAALSSAYRGEVATMPGGGREGALRPADVTYELELPVEDMEGALRDGMVGRAKVLVEKKTLGWTVYVWLLQTIRQDLRI